VLAFAGMPAEGNATASSGNHGALVAANRSTSTNSTLATPFAAEGVDMIASELHPLDRSRHDPAAVITLPENPRNQYSMQTNESSCETAYPSQ